MTDTGKKPSLPQIGWREWVALPDLGVGRIKVKVDTGARSSALHAFDLKRFRRGGQDMIRFKVHPLQRDSKVTVEAESVLTGERLVRDSGGKQTRRPVILTSVEVLGQRWPIELTLTARDEMGFRMLLGRQAIRKRFLVHAGRSYLGEKARRKAQNKKKPVQPENPRR